MMQRLACFLLLVLTAAFWVSGPAVAGAPEPQKPAFQLAPPAVDRAITSGRPSEPAAQPGMFQRAWNWLLYQQQRINRQLADAVKDLKAQGSFTAAAVLAWLSFMYGVLHAAGPGHGKAIIASYVLANERTVRRGIMLSFLSALIQALSAITIVGVMAIVLNATSIQMKNTENTIETVSWAFVAAVGAWLLYDQIRRIWGAKTSAPQGHQHTHDLSAPTAAKHSHGDGEHGDCPDCGHDHHAHNHSHKHHHNVHDGHDHSDCCGHAHMPDPKDLEGSLSWTKALAIAFSVGIRPCTGAILVLIFAMSQGMLWAGIFSTFAMAIGTAITVSVLASMAVGSREFAAKYGGSDGRWATRVATAAGLTGSALVFLMGTAFFIGSLQTRAPF
jgi:nickel/cobalt transporter (NicO) family protein